MRHFLKTKQEHDHSKYEFILIELERVLRFLQIGTHTNGKMESIKTALMAYVSAQNFLGGAALTSAMQANMQARLDQLAPLIESGGTSE